MKKAFIFIGVIIILTSCSIIRFGRQTEPPKLKKEISYIVNHGDTLFDEYAWVKDKLRQNSVVKKHLQQENSYTEYMLKDTEKLQKTLFKEYLSRIPKNDTSLPTLVDSFFYYWKIDKKSQYDTYYRRLNRNGAEEELILDENKLAKGSEFFTLGFLSKSPDHNLLAMGIDRYGYERYQLYIKDLSKDEFLDIGEIYADDVSWFTDNKTFYYTLVDSTGRTFRTFRHTLGQELKEDQVVFEENDKAFYVWTHRSSDDKYMLISSGSKTTTETWYLPADKPFSEPKLLQSRIQDMEYYVDHRNGKFIITTNADGAFDYKIVTVDVDNPKKENWKDLIPHRPGIVTGCDVFRDNLIVTETEDGLTKLRIIKWEDMSEYYVEVSQDVYNLSYGGSANYVTDSIRYGYSSYNILPKTYSLNLKTGEKTLLKERKLNVPYNGDDYATKKVLVTADDGEKVPMFMVYRRDKIDFKSPVPVYLDVYGAYGDNNTPYFSSALISLLDRGVLFATASIRGGGDKGKQWHIDGRMLKKKNTFTDFINCAEYLIEEGYTTKDMLVATGGSAGGLTVGAALNMKSDIFGAVILDVPFVDLMNTMFDPELSATVSEYEEWGNPNIDEYYQYMKSYCPYTNIKKKIYPDMLVLCGYHDTRVNYWEPMKYVARLRDNKIDNNVILLHTDFTSGHSGASGKYDYLKRIALVHAYVLTKTLN